MDKESAVYNTLYRRYMSALSLQYEGYRLMLNDNTYELLGFFTITKLDDGRLYLDCGEYYKPVEAKEAYMFAPLGYWKTVNEDPLYPDDYPLDIMQSINSGTATIEEKNGVFLNQDMPDGLYEYYYNFYDVWEKLIVVVKDKKIIKINRFDVGNCDDTVIYCEDSGIFAINFEVNSPLIEEIPTTLTVAQFDSSELPINLVVKIDVVENIPTDFIVTYVSDVPTYLNVRGTNDLPVHIDVYREVIEDKPQIDLIVKQYDKSELPINIVVKIDASDEIPVSMLVYTENRLPTDIVVQRMAYSDLPAWVNIQRVEESEFPVSLIVKQYVYDAPQVIWDFIVVQKDNSDIPTSMYVVGNGAYKEGIYNPTELPINFAIEQKEKTNYIPTHVTVRNITDSAIPVHLIVMEYENSFENVIRFEKEVPKGSSQLPITISVANKAVADGFETFVYVINNPILESVADGITKRTNDLPVIFGVGRYGKLETPVSMVVVRKPVLETVAQLTIKTKTELPTMLSVINHAVSEIKTTMVVTRIPILETAHNMDYAHIEVEQEIPINIMVGSVYLNKDVPVYMNVIARNSAMETHVGVFAQQGKPSSVKTTLTVVRHEDQKGFGITMNVIHKPSVFKSIADFLKRRNSDLPIKFNVVYGRENLLPMTMYVNPLAQMNTVAEIRTQINEDLRTFVAVPNIETGFEMTMYVSTEKTTPVVEAFSRLVPHQLAKVNLHAKKDSYTYNLAQTMNYGRKPRMNIANTKSYDIMSSIIGFDFTDLNIDMKDISSEYFEYETIQKVVMNLNIESKLKQEAMIKVYAVEDNWIETNINYKNLQKLDRYLVTEVPAPKETGRFTIDITDDFSHFEQQKKLKRSYLLALETKSKDNSIITISSLQSALSDQEKPSVTVTYWHTPPNADWVDIDTTLEVNPWEDLPTTLYVTDPVYDDLPTTLEIAAQSVDTRLFTINVWVVQTHTTDDLPTTLDVIGYPCDENGTKIRIFVNFSHISIDIDTTLTVVRNPDKEAYIYLL